MSDHNGKIRIINPTTYAKERKEVEDALRAKLLSQGKIIVKSVLNHAVDREMRARGFGPVIKGLNRQRKGKNM